MIRLRVVLTSVVFIALFSSLSVAQDLGQYRDFRFGMDVASVLKLVQMDASEVKTTHERPALIRTLQWNQSGYSSFVEPPRMSSVRSIRFDFYDGELSRMVVAYDPVGTDGLTADDIAEAISAVYGTAGKPEDSIAVSNLTTYREKVLARWEDAQYSYNLIRFSYGNAFGLVAFSKTLDLMASASTRESERLDRLEAPAKELARLKKQADDRLTAQEAARSINKPKFRP